MRYPRRNIKDVDIQKLKVKLDGAKHFRVIGGGESMGMDEIRFNHTVKRGPRLKKLPYPMWTRQRRMSPKRRQKRKEGKEGDILILAGSVAMQLKTPFWDVKVPG